MPTTTNNTTTLLAGSTVGDYISLELILNATADTTSIL